MNAALYLRKSNDEGDKSTEAKSIEVQRDLAERFAAARGWTIDPQHIFTDDGISGAVFDRPGLQALLAALRAKPAPFKHVIVVDQSRLGRDTVGVLNTLDEIEKAGVAVWSTHDGRQITLEDDFGEIVTLLSGWWNKVERRDTIRRVKSNAAKRFADGFVVSGCPYGYKKTERAYGSKAAMRLLIDEAEAAIVRRIFEMAAKGQGLRTIARQLNNEGVDGPRGRKWSLSGVRELLHRETYVGVLVFGKQIRTGPGEKVRVTDPTKWQRRADESLRIVSDDLWGAAHARIEATAAKLLRNNGKLVGQVERTRGQYLLSGFLTCGTPDPTKPSGICGETMIATKRGRNASSVYICRGAREARGTELCKHGVPMDELNIAVVESLRKTFSAESFERHLQTVAADEEAREQRRAERAHLLAEIPKLAARRQSWQRPSPSWTTPTRYSPS